MRVVLAVVALGVAACGGSSEGESSPTPEPDGGLDAAGGQSGSAGASGGGGSSGGSAGSSGSGAAPNDAASDVTSSCGLSQVPPGTSTFEVSSSGEQRTARLIVPASYDASKHVPLVIVMHGYTQTAEAIENISEMTPLAEQHGFVLVYPQGIGNSWNAGKCCGSASSSARPDVAFISDLIDALSKELCIDPKRIYAAGFSNGGMLSNRLACELSDRIAAFAPVAGPRAIDACAPTRPMPMIEFHGTNDFVVPYNGNGLGGAVSVADNVNSWKTNAGCTDASPTEVYQNGDSTCVEYSQCAAGSKVRLCTVDGGGHQWPGGQSAGAIAGKLTQDIDASAQMVDFFFAHSLP